MKAFFSRVAVASLFAIFLAAPLAAQSLYEMPQGVETRWASSENPSGAKGQAAQANHGRKGHPTIQVKAGQSVVLAEEHGRPGTVRRIWMTFWDRSPKMLRSLRIDMYWDGAKTPAVSAPVGDFFGMPLGEAVKFDSALFTNPEGRSFNSIVPMPFRTGMKIVLTNESDKDEDNVYYDVDYTLGDRFDANTLYFHAYFRRESPTALKRDYEILPHVSGRGRYLGANLGVIADKQRYGNTWWGEGEVKVYLDGDANFPTLSGTGTEDYIRTAWGQGAYSDPYEGSPFADGKNMRYGFYRYHVPDPIYFYKEARVTIQQIGHVDSINELPEGKRDVYRAGPDNVKMDASKGGLFERQDDWSSCVYFYLDRPENGLPPIAPVSERTKGL